MKSFIEDHKAEVNTLAEYVAWLEKRDPMAPRILFTYRVWGSTRMSDREMTLDETSEDASAEELQQLAEIVLGLRRDGHSTYEWEGWYLGFDVHESMDPEELAMGAEVVVPEDRLVRRTAHTVFENCATYFVEIRDSLRNIILDIEKFVSQRKLIDDDTFWEDFIKKAASVKTTETQLWDFKETLNIWHVQGEPARGAAKVEFAEDVASFANSTGGLLVVGVTDKRQIVGVGDGRQLENRLKTARDVLADHIVYEREIATFHQVPITDDNGVRICLVIIISQAYTPVGVGDGNGRYTYPVRRETGIARVPRDKVTTARRSFA